MTFDSTIVSVQLNGLNFSYDSLAPAGIRRFAIVLLTAHQNIDPADLTPPLTDNIGPTWMYSIHNSHNISGVAPQNIAMTPSTGVTVRSKRRFKENNETLWMGIQTITEGLETNWDLSGLVRVLIHIP